MERAMRWVRVKTENGPSYGIIDGDIVSLVKNCLFDDIEFTDESLSDIILSELTEDITSSET